MPPLLSSMSMYSHTCSVPEPVTITTPSHARQDALDWQDGRTCSMCSTHGCWRSSGSKQASDAHMQR